MVALLGFGLFERGFPVVPLALSRLHFVLSTCAHDHARRGYVDEELLVHPIDV